MSLSRRAGTDIDGRCSLIRMNLISLRLPSGHVVDTLSCSLQVRIISSGTCWRIADVDLDHQRLYSTQMLWSHLQCPRFLVMVSSIPMSSVSLFQVSATACSIIASCSCSPLLRSCCHFTYVFAIVAPPSTSHRPLPMTQVHLHCFHLLQH
jgi:hypothetical protein